MVKKQSQPGSRPPEKSKLWVAITVLTMAVATIPLLLVLSTAAQIDAITDFAVNLLTIAIALLK